MMNQRLLYALSMCLSAVCFGSPSIEEPSSQPSDPPLQEASLQEPSSHSTEESAPQPSDLTLQKASLQEESSQEPSSQPIAYLESIILEPDSAEAEMASDLSQKGIILRTRLPGDPNKIISQLKPFLGQPFSEELLVSLKDRILTHYRDAGYPLVIAKIPEQDVSQGTLKIQILEGRVGEIRYQGNRWFSDKTLSRYVHLEPGDPIHQDRLLNDVASLNRNPFHYTEVILAPGKKRGETQVEFNTKDRFPLRFYAGADNTGIDVTGQERYYAGFNWGNVGGSGDLLTYQWTTAAFPHRFNSHYLGYTSLLSWYHTLSLWGAYAEIHPKMTHFTSEGKLVQGSLRYMVPLRPLYKPFSHQWGVGFDFKRTNSNLFFAEVSTRIPLVTKSVNLTQLLLTYQLESRPSKHEITFSTEVYGSPGKWLPDQSNRNFASLRAHAKNRYIYGRVSLGDIYHLFKHFSIMGMVRGQGASGALLPSEQFGLGGYNTVRGYDERDFDADNALCANLELRGPKIPLTSNKEKNHFYLLAFGDYGLGHNYHHDLTGRRSTEYLLSAGVGARLLLAPYITARVDYGFQLHHISLSHKRFGKLHFSATASY